MTKCVLVHAVTPSLNFTDLMICVSGLNEALCCVCLCVEGVYGDVMRVKILFNKKENALVQMADATQAQLGKYNSLFTVLDGAREGG